MQSVRHRADQRQVVGVVPRRVPINETTAERNGVTYRREERQQAGHVPTLDGTDRAAPAEARRRRRRRRAAPPDPDGAEPRRGRPDETHPRREVDGEDVRRRQRREVVRGTPSAAAVIFRERVRHRRGSDGGEGRMQCPLEEVRDGRDRARQAFELESRPRR